MTSLGRHLKGERRGLKDREEGGCMGVCRREGSPAVKSELC